MNYANDEIIEKKIPEIVAQVNLLRTEIDTQVEAIEELAIRLSSVTNPVIDENAKDDGTRPSLVPLAGDINNAADRIHINTERIEDILRRLEL